MRCACGTSTPHPSQPLHLARRPIVPGCAAADTMRYAASGKVIPHQPTSASHIPHQSRSDGKVWGGARSDLAEIQDITIWSLLVAWPAATVLYLSVAFFEIR